MNGFNNFHKSDSDSPVTPITIFRKCLMCRSWKNTKASIMLWALSSCHRQGTISLPQHQLYSLTKLMSVRAAVTMPT